MAPEAHKRHGGGALIRRRPADITASMRTAPVMDDHARLPWRFHGLRLVLTGAA
jgi:hypothetical protein